MGRQALEVADIFRDHGPAWRDANRGHLSLGQLKVMNAIESCRTAALGGHVMRCENDACGYTAIAYNSCRNRHCPKCQGAAALEWMEARAAEAAARAILPRGVHTAVANRRYRLSEQNGDLRSTVPGVGRDDADDCRRPQASRRQNRHHRSVAQLGIGDDASSARAHDRAGRRHRARWITVDRQAAPLLSARARAVEALPQADDREARRRARRRPVDVPRRTRRARRRQAVRRLSGAAQEKALVRLHKRPLAGPEAVLAYRSRYTHRVAISNRRLIAADAKTVTFKVKDYRINGPGRYKTMTLDTHEFIRRFLIHVLPNGFHRIRHYGLLASGVKADNLVIARKLLDVAPPAPGPEDIATEPPTPLKPCPCCGSTMRIIEVFKAGEPARHKPAAMPAAIENDTS